MVHLATSGLSPPSPRTLNESPENQGCKSDSVLGTTHHSTWWDKPKEDPTSISLNLGDFEKTLQDLDKDILGFEKGVKDQRDSNDPLHVPDQAHSAHIAPSIGLTDKTPQVQPIMPTPLIDRTNMDLDHNILIAQSEGKWLRIQRPTHF
nr:hypothetical protein CFP56_44879 [Quercus suber]